MAIQKQIVLDNGIITNYHRIVSINQIVNKQTIIEIGSYTSQEKREEEKAYYESQEPNKSMNVYINTEYIPKEYDANETIENAYEYINTLDKYKDGKKV